MKVASRITTGYNPRLLQDHLHKSLKRFSVVICHRRFGKSVFAVNEGIHRLLTCDKRDPQIAYIAPTYSQAKKVAWDIVKSYLRPIPGVQFNEAELRADFPTNHGRARFMLLGAENPDSLRGLYLDYAILDEVATMPPSVWIEVVRPALLDRTGGALFIGTPAGKNLLKDLYDYAISGKDDEWFCAHYPASKTNLIPQKEIDALKAVMSDETFSQELECSFTAPNSGSYYGKEMDKAKKEGRITSVPYDKSVGVITGFDLGISDTTCIWFAQLVGKEIHFIDYIEMSGEGLDYYAKELKDRGYLYDEHLLPHDAAARELGTGRSRQETLLSMKVKPLRIVPRQSVEDGINAVRMILNRSWFDEKKCARGISALEGYSRNWDEKNQIWSNKAKHDWASHGADALRTFAMGLSENSSRYRYDIENVERVADTDYDIYNY